MGAQQRENVPAGRAESDAAKAPAPSAPGLALAFLVAAGFLYLNLFALPKTPYLVGSDVYLFMENAIRMLHGEVMYRDFVSITPPGTESVFWICFKTFGVHLSIPNALLWLLGMGLFGLSYALARQLTTGWTAILPGAVFLTSAYRAGFNDAQYWLSLLPALGALTLVLRRRSTGRLAAAGALLGVASFFVQTIGFLGVLGILGFFLWERFGKHQLRAELLQRCATLIGWFALVTLAWATVVARQVGLKALLWATLIFNLRYYGSFRRYNNFAVYFVQHPSFLPWFRLPAIVPWAFVHALIPFVYVFFLMRFARRGFDSTASWDRPLLICFFGLSIFASAASAPAWGRLVAVSLPGILIFVWAVERWARTPRIPLAVVWVLVGLFAAGEAVYGQVRRRQEIVGPYGRIAIVRPQTYAVYRAVQVRTHPGEYVCEANGEDILACLGLRNPISAPFLTPDDFTRPEQARRALAGLDRDGVKCVIWNTELDAFAERHAKEDHLRPIRAYLRRNFRLVASFGREEIFLRGAER